MAVTITAVDAGTYTKTWAVIASADADTAGTITHGFTGTPAVVALTPLKAVAYTAQWVVSAYNASQIVLGKTSAGTSSDAAAQLLVVASLPHSIAA